MSEETEKLPAWMQGTGLESDMTGDPTPGAMASKRFWMPKGSERKIIFLTEGNRAPVIWEHQVRLGGKWTNWFTCVADLGVHCHLCGYADKNDGMFRRSKVMIFTVIDTNEWTDKQGKTHKNVKKMLAAKKDTTELLKRKYLKRLEADQGLRGAMFDVYRTSSDKSPSVGDEFTFDKMIDLTALEDTEEFDYAVELAPDPAKNKRVYEQLVAASEGEGTDAKVPFD